MDDIVLFNECSVENIKVVGKKAAFLAELYSKGFNVPDGFIITGNLFVKFVEIAGIKQNIAEILVSNEDRGKKAMKIQQIILNTHFPEDMADFIYKGYSRLSSNEQEENEPFVALKVSSSSDHVEDSFFLNISGRERLINGIKSCWASVFSENNLELKRFKPSVIVQKMIHPVRSGLIYSRNPINGSSEEVLIQVCSGLGNVVSLSQGVPSAYIVRKSDLMVLGEDLKEQQVRYALSMEKRRTVKIEEDEVTKNILDEHIIEELVKLATRAEERMNDPVRISFALDKSVNVVSAKPIDVREFQRKFGESYNFEQESETEYRQPASQGPDEREQQRAKESIPDGSYKGYQNENDFQSAPTRPETASEDMNQSTTDDSEDGAYTGQQEDTQKKDYNGFQQENRQAENDEAELLKYYQPDIHHKSEGPESQTSQDVEEPSKRNNETGPNSNENTMNIEKEQISETRESFINKHMPEEPEIYLKKAGFVNQMNLINSDMIITSALRKKYRNLFAKEPPMSRDAIISELKTRVNVPFEDEIRQIRLLRDELINNLREPKQKDIDFSVTTASRLVKEF
ncbi:MAG: PEP/pyruvate-binding domain-containing protein [Candidatus Woesearchaeota archaeon]